MPLLQSRCSIAVYNLGALKFPRAPPARCTSRSSHADPATAIRGASALPGRPGAGACICSSMIDIYAGVWSVKADSIGTPSCMLWEGKRAGHSGGGELAARAPRVQIEAAGGAAAAAARECICRVLIN
eukprot:SAG31_NODE_17398_length_672_cov_1.005236_1_plen_127_part_01